MSVKPSCPICRGESIWSLALRGVAVQLCRTCLHAETPHHRGAVERYYQDKSKWDRFLQRYQQEGFIPAMQTRYIERARRVSEQASRIGLGPSQGSLLDVGSAAGFFLVATESRFQMTLGTELDRAAARFARIVFHQEVIEGGLECAEVQQSAPFDIVTCFHVLEHVPDPVALVESMVGVLRDGGLLILAMPVIEMGRKRTNFFREFPVADGAMNLESEHIHHFSRLSALHLLTHANLQLVETRIHAYKARKSLREIEVVARRVPNRQPHCELREATAWESWRMRASLSRWAYFSRHRVSRRTA